MKIKYGRDDKITGGDTAAHGTANMVMPANERFFGNRLTIKEVFIWLEETKIFFYNIKKCNNDGKTKTPVC